jgi:hypothetical protein
MFCHIRWRIYDRGQIQSLAKREYELQVGDFSTVEQSKGGNQPAARAKEKAPHQPVAMGGLF